jgi:hypothetical protein
MDRDEARAILSDELEAYRRRSRKELEASMVEPTCMSRIARSGTSYQLEIEVFWDDSVGGDIRVIGSIDDGGIRAFFPLTMSLLVKQAAEGS